MTSQETIFIFGIVMLVFALLAVIIDWFGKPMRGRKFIPKMYRYPDERMPRRSGIRPTQWSEAAFVLPVPAQVAARATARQEREERAIAEQERQEFEREERRYEEEQARYERELAEYNASLEPPEVMAQPQPADPIAPAHASTAVAAGLLFDAPDPEPVAEAVEPTPAPSEEPVPLHESTPSNEAATVEAVPTDLAPTDLTPTDPAPTDPATADKPVVPANKPAKTTSKKKKKSKKTELRQREKGWKVGSYIYNFTGEGAEPSPATVRNRYWRNVSNAKGSGMFGQRNQERMTEGKAPQRRNPRSGKLESMHLPALSYKDTNGAIPVPEWPGNDVDPYAKSHKSSGKN